MKEIPFWKDLAERWREKIKTLSLSDEIEPEPDDFPAPADEREAFSEESGEEDHLVKTFACGEEMEEGLWTILSSCHGSGGRSRDGFSCREKRKVLPAGEVNWLRVGQGMSALFAAAGILCFILLGYTFLEEREAEAKLAGCPPYASKWMRNGKEREKENQLLSELKSLEENDLRWEQKLVALSECTPQGIVLSEINAGEGMVHITGTADSPVTAMRFQKELEKAWGGKTYIEKQKREPNLKMAAFTLLWKGGQP